MHLWILFELGARLQLFRESLDQLEAFIHVRVFAATEDDGEDDLIFAGQEFFRSVDLGHQVLVADFWAEAEFFVFAVMSVAFVLPLLLLVLEFAEIHDAANGRLLLGSDLDEVHAGVAGLLQSFDGFDNAQQGAILSDDTNRRNADLLVDPLTFLSEGDGKVS